MLFEQSAMLSPQAEASIDTDHMPAVAPNASVPATRVQPEQRTFLLPRSIWTIMLVAYAVFFACITAATGHDTGTLFVIAISIGYTVMYFGTAAVLNGLSRQRPVSAGKPIDTLTGPLSYRAACAQILTVPVLLALFGAAIAIIRAVVG